MGKNPSIVPIYDDNGNLIGVKESGLTQSQKAKGNKPKPKTETVKPKSSSKKR